MNKLCLLFCSIALFATGCYQYHYAPNTHATPIFVRKGEKQINGGIAMQSLLQSGELQAAWSPMRNIGIVANGLYTNSTVSRGRNRTRLGFGEAGIGVQHIFTNSFATPDFPEGFVCALYSGVGYGHTRNIIKEQSAGLFAPKVPVIGFMDIQYNRVYLQGFIGYATPMLEFGISLRAAQVNIFDGYFSGGADDVLASLHKIREKNHYQVLEPATFIRYGSERFKLQLQMGTSQVPTRIGLRKCVSLGGVWQMDRKKTYKKVKK